MGQFKIFFNKFAENDLEVSKEFYKKQKDGSINKFLVELKRIIKRIEENPFQFPKIEEEARKANLNKFPFAVLFVVKDEIINIFSIFHFSRNPKIWKKEYNLCQK